MYDPARDSWDMLASERRVDGHHAQVLKVWMDGSRVSRPSRLSLPSVVNSSLHGPGLYWGVSFCDD